jgi:hypothetical protein
MTISSDGEQLVKDLQRNTKITQIAERGAERRIEQAACSRSPYQELVISVRSLKNEETESSFGETTFKLWGDDFQVLRRLESSFGETTFKLWGDEKC